jgi:hypothetical protein
VYVYVREYMWMCPCLCMLLAEAHYGAIVTCHERAVPTRSHILRGKAGKRDALVVLQTQRAVSSRVNVMGEGRNHQPTGRGGARITGDE